LCEFLKLQDVEARKREKISRAGDEKSGGVG
jgi:hypothetical protein